jgi:hypothetical protein
VEDGVLRDAEGRPFAFEILLAQGQAEVQAIVASMPRRCAGWASRCASPPWTPRNIPSAPTSTTST